MGGCLPAWASSLSLPWMLPKSLPLKPLVLALALEPWRSAWGPSKLLGLDPGARSVPRSDAVSTWGWSEPGDASVTAPGSSAALGLSKPSELMPRMTSVPKSGAKPAADLLPPLRSISGDATIPASRDRPEWGSTEGGVLIAGVELLPVTVCDPSRSVESPAVASGACSVFC